MSVILRHPGIGLYYASRKHWVGSPRSAVDLGTVERAVQLSRAESFDEMDIVVTCEDRAGEVVIPVRRGRADDADPIHKAA